MYNNTIKYYENYLLKTNKEIEKTLNKNIDIYEKEAKVSLEKLLRKSKEYKLYDKDYEEFMMNMGKLAISLSKLKENQSYYITIFLQMNDVFEELQQKNIMKDAYVWK